MEIKRRKKIQKRYGRILIEFVNAKDEDDMKVALRKGMKRWKKQWDKISDELKEKEINLTLSKINANAQTHLKAIIDDVLEQKNLYENESINDYIDSYNSYFSSIVVVNSDGSLSEVPSFFRKKSIPHRALISYNLLNFLRIDEYYEYLHKCSVCSNYFIKLKKSKKTKRCPVCSLKTTLTREQLRQWYIDHKKEVALRKKKKKLIKSYMEGKECSEEDAKREIRKLFLTGSTVRLKCQDEQVTHQNNGKKERFSFFLI